MDVNNSMSWYQQKNIESEKNPNVYKNYEVKIEWSTI